MAEAAPVPPSGDVHAASDRRISAARVGGFSDSSATLLSSFDSTRRRQVAALAQQFEKGVFTSDTSVKRASDVQEQGRRSFDYLKTLMQKLRDALAGQHVGLLDELTLGIDTLEIQWRRKEIYLKEACMEARKAAEEFRDAAEHLDREARGLRATGSVEHPRQHSTGEPPAGREGGPSTSGLVSDMRQRWSLDGVGQAFHRRKDPAGHTQEHPSHPAPTSQHLHNGSSAAAGPKQRAAPVDPDATSLRAELARATALLSLREGELQQLRMAHRTSSQTQLQHPTPQSPASTAPLDSPHIPDIARLVVPPPRICRSFTAGQHPDTCNDLQVVGQAALGETLRVIGVPAECPMGTVQWCRIQPDGQQEPIALATTPQYAPEPDDVGRPLGAIVRRDRLSGLPYNESTPHLTFLPGPAPVEGSPGLEEYVKQMMGQGWGIFNCIVVSCNGREAERRRVYAAVVLPTKLKLQQAGKTRWKQEYHPGMQVTGARGPGANAAQGAYVCFKPTLSFMLAFENAHERNAFLMLSRKMADVAGVKLGAPSYDLWGPL